ncbi:MAG: BLUF domain-containing protein [Hydrogenophaga sp.]|uniref:BLUF domain-containing protein n=1 Tax=Hydrogenophaga sp. TaxID=1904254 RepID=UPI002752CCAF|nr:BLUF domain-containing protein [Hydrogenophaga sp.]MDP2419012.1 BLUF domain-containing protein [Hydrogenophaga sp.]MDZ4190071.1 BLUF domain-containing protein [Hydrogenophaga sp.]
MLVRVFYVSAAVGPQTTAVTQSILQQSQAYNCQHGITGVLLQGQGIYLQALEGEQDEVNRLYARIASDPRHNRVEMVHCENIEQRRYGNWSMAHAELSDLDPMTQIEWQTFDPHSITGLLVLARIDQLIETGQMIG